MEDGAVLSLGVGVTAGWLSLTTCNKLPDKRHRGREVMMAICGACGFRTERVSGKAVTLCVCERKKKSVCVRQSVAVNVTERCDSVGDIYSVGLCNVKAVSRGSYTHSTRPARFNAEPFLKFHAVSSTCLFCRNHLIKCDVSKSFLW